MFILCRYCIRNLSDISYRRTHQKEVHSPHPITLLKAYYLVYFYFLLLPNAFFLETNMGFYCRCRTRPEMHTEWQVRGCPAAQLCAKTTGALEVTRSLLAPEANQRGDPEQMQNLSQQFVGTKYLL